MLEALRFLTIIPLPANKARKANARWLTHHGWQAPMSGLLIGFLCAVLALITTPLLPPALCAILAVACSALLSGALHEDGLADTADSLGTPKTQRLQTMHDPRCGSFAILALILSFATRTTALAFLFTNGTLVLPLLLTHTAARSAFPLWCRYLKPHPKTSLARLLDNTTPNIFSIVSPFLVINALVFLLLEPLFATLFLTTLVACSLLLLPLFKRLFGAMSGDLCGCGEQILECSLLLCLCILQQV